jgi:protein-S-isoprenylcysteine O-methyltransferase Ste14
MDMDVDRTGFAENDPGRSTFRKVHQAYLLATVGVVFWSISSTYWSTGNLPSEASFSVGVLLVAIGFAGRLWVSTYQAGYKNKSLIMVGPYSLCRNPMYFCNLLGGLGACLTTGTITAPALFLAAYVFHYRRVIRDEEARLRRHHGAAFDAYRAATPRLLPSIKNFKQPEEYIVRMRDLSERIPLALWPIAAVALIHFGAALHAHHLLPDLLRIY